MKKQKLLKDLDATQDPELIESFNELMGVNTDDCFLLNKELFIEEIDEDDPFDIGPYFGKMRA